MKKRHEERLRKREEIKEYERLTGSPHPSTLAASGSSTNNKLAAKRHNKRHVKRKKPLPQPPKNGPIDPVLLQKKLELYRLKMQQKNQGQ